MKLRKYAVLACLALVAALAVAVPAGAHGQKISDRNDVPGPLDISKVTAAHTGTKITHTIQTFATWKARLLRGGDNFLMGWFSTDGDSTDAERLVYIVYQGGKLRGIAANAKGQALFGVRVTRPNARTVKFALGTNWLTNDGGYAWGGFSFYKAAGKCRRFCVDAAPQRGPKWLDYTAPVVDILTTAPNGLTTDIDSSLAPGLQVFGMDLGSANFTDWELQRRALGGAWSTVDSDMTSTSVQPEWALGGWFTEGATYEYRVIVDDGPHFSQSRILRLTAPYDDATAGTFSAGWTSRSDAYSDYLATLHSTSTVDETFTYSFNGSQVLLLGRGDAGAVSVSVDGGPEQAITMPTAPLSVFFKQDLASGPHTVVVTVTGGTVHIDGAAHR